MADQANGGAAGSTPSGGSVASGQAQPATTGGDSISLPRAEYEKYIRYGEQVKGFQPFYEKAKNFGISRAEDFDKFDPYYKSMQQLEKRGIKPDALARIYSDEAEQELGKPEQQSFDPAKFEKDITSKIERQFAEREWDSLTKKEAEYVDAALRDIMGDEKVDDMSKAMYRRAVANYLDEIREMYPKDHPLHDSRLQPIGEAHAKKAVEFFKAEKAKYAGSASAAKADAAIAAEKKGVTASAGRSGGNGAPEKKPRLPGYRNEQEEAAEAEKLYAALKAKRNAGR